MRVHASVIRGPTLYRHGCRKCAEETLHNYLGCVRCQAYPFTAPVKLPASVRGVLAGKSHVRKGRPA